MNKIIQCHEEAKNYSYPMWDEMNIAGKIVLGWWMVLVSYPLVFLFVLLSKD